MANDLAEVWDCHVHVFGENLEDHPQSIGFTLDDYLEKVSSPLGLKRIVLVQPSRLGTNHEVLFQALDRLRGRGRAVVVLDESTTSETLINWHALGVRGIRYAPRLGQGGSLEFILALAPLLNRMDWHVQLYADIEQLVEVSKKLNHAGVKIVFDHFARLHPGLCSESDVLRFVCKLLAEGNSWIKLSAPYHFSKEGSPFGDLSSIARTLYNANPKRVIWGTDWPHPNSPAELDESVLLQCLEQWGFKIEERINILRANPSNLYR